MDEQLELIPDPKFKFPARGIWIDSKSKKQFGNWWAHYTRVLGIVEGKGFLTQWVKNPLGGRPRKDYLLDDESAELFATYAFGSRSKKRTRAKHQYLQQQAERAFREVEPKNSPIRLLAAESRKKLTKEWVARDVDTPRKIQIATNNMRDGARIKVCKDEMTKEELLRIGFAEQVATKNIIAADAKTYSHVIAISEKAARDVAALEFAAEDARSFGEMRSLLE